MISADTEHAALKCTVECCGLGDTQAATAWHGYPRASQESHRTPLNRALLRARHSKGTSYGTH